MYVCVCVYIRRKESSLPLLAVREFDSKVLREKLDQMHTRATEATERSPPTEQAMRYVRAGVHWTRCLSSE
jgi:hypothetical protein